MDARHGQGLWRLLGCCARDGVRKGMVGNAAYRRRCGATRSWLSCVVENVRSGWQAEKPDAAGLDNRGHLVGRSESGIHTATAWWACRWPGFGTSLPPVSLCSSSTVSTAIAGRSAFGLRGNYCDFGCSRKKRSMICVIDEGAASIVVRR